MSDDRHDPDSLPEFRVGLEIEATEHNIRAVLKDLDDEIQRVGWALVGNGAAESSEDDSDFTYTLGLHRRGLPDIVTRGLCGCSDEVVATIADRQLKAGAFEDGQISQIQGTPVRLSVWPHTAYFRLLNEYYRYYSSPPTLLMVSPL